MRIDFTHLGHACRVDARWIPAPPSPWRRGPWSRAVSGR